RHTRFSRDWSSDVCSSDLVQVHSMYCSSAICWKGGMREYFNSSLRAEHVNQPGSGLLRQGAVSLGPQHFNRHGDSYGVLTGGTRSEERRVGKGGRSGGRTE